MNPQYLRKKFRDAGVSADQVRPPKPPLVVRLRDPEVIRACGYWLERWQGHRHPTYGTTRKRHAA